MKSMHHKPADHSVSPLVARLNAQSNGHSFAFIYLTNECQLNCEHCSFQSGPGKPHTRMDGPMLLRTLGELSGIRDITLTGGEPTLHPHFREVLAKAARKASNIYLLTNGISFVGKERLRALAGKNSLPELIRQLRASLNAFPAHLRIFFPLDSFHLKTCRPYGFLLRGLAALAKEWYGSPNRPVIGFLSNETSEKKSRELIEAFSVGESTHVGTAGFAPWRNARDVHDWYSLHPLNRTPFAGGLYLNYLGVYLNEASLLLDLREGIETRLKIGRLSPASSDYRQLEKLSRRTKGGRP